MIIMKFGGTSVGSPAAIQRTISIIRDRLPQKPIVVVSAMSKVTDMLYAISDSLSKADKTSALAALETLRQKHLSAAAELLCEDQLWKEEAFSRVNEICNDLSRFIYSVSAVDDAAKAVIDSKGEYLSSNIIYCKMNSLGIKTEWVNARDFMITDSEYLCGKPRYEQISRLAPKIIDAAFSTSQAVITQGFVGITSEGEQTVLGRGGSDYSASLIGMAVDAQRIEIWTDVDGVRSADPRKVEGTLCIPKISFEEAAEMASYGAKVLHPKTIEPALLKNIPVFVLNSMNPQGKGTEIVPSQYIEDGVRSVSSKENISLVRVSTGVLSDPSSLLSRVCRVLGESLVEPDLIAARPDELLFTTASASHLPDAVVALSRFATVRVEEDAAQVSVIGKNISELKLALREASELVGKSSLVSITQSDSYVNISFVVPRSKVSETVRDIHKYLFE